MRKSLFGIALALAIPFTALAQSYSTTLTGGAAVPGGGDADGVGIAVVAVSGNTVNYSLLLQNIDSPTAAHIHSAAAGSVGPVVVDLAASFNGLNATGSVAVDQAVADAIKANPGAFYVDVHTAAFPNGAVRGQLATPGAGGGDVEVFLPIAGKVAGANNTNFVTDLRVINTGTTAAEVTIEFFAQSASGSSAPTATASVTIPAGAQAVLNDFVSAQLQASGLGGVRIRSSQPVVAAARIINDLRGAGLGTSGFSVDAKSRDEAKLSGTLPFLAQASAAEQAAGSGFRTNIGYFNPSAAPVTLTLTARSSANGAVLGSSTVTVPAFGQAQVAAFSLIPIAASVTDGERADFYVTYTATAPLFVYGSVVDNKTGDPVYID